MTYHTIFMVVYGQDNGDIMYFSDMLKAKQKLLYQSMNQSRGFKPMLYTYVENDGVYVRTKDVYIAKDYAQFVDHIYAQSDHAINDYIALQM